MPSQISPGNQARSNETVVLTVGLGTLMTLFLVFLIYWFGMRDTWESDNHRQIVQHCESVIDAARKPDDKLTIQEHGKLTSFIHGHVIESETLSGQIEQAQSMAAPAFKRGQQANIDRAKQRAKQAKALAVHKRLAQEFANRHQSSQASSGSVDYSLIETFKASWRKGRWRYKSKEEQGAIMFLMIASVKKHIADPADREATLDYVQRTIESW